MESNKEEQMLSHSDSTDREPVSARQQVDTMRTRRSHKRKPDFDESVGKRRPLQRLRSHGDTEEVAVDDPSLDVTLTPQRQSEEDGSLSLVVVSPNVSPTVRSDKSSSSHNTDYSYLLTAVSGGRREGTSCQEVPPTPSDLHLRIYLSGLNYKPSNILQTDNAGESAQPSTSFDSRMCADAQSEIQEKTPTSFNTDVDVEGKGGHKLVPRQISQKLHDRSKQSRTTDEKSSSSSSSRCSKRDSGAEADIDDTDRANSSSSMDIIDATDYAIHAANKEERRKEKVLNQITNTLQLISERICALRAAATDLFGGYGDVDNINQVGSAAGSEPLGDPVIDESSGSGEVASSYEWMLNAVKEYVRQKTYQENIPQELNVNQPMEEPRNVVDTEEVSTGLSGVAIGSQQPARTQMISGDSDICVESRSASVSGARVDNIKPDSDEERWIRKVCKTAKNTRKRVLRQYGMVSAFCTAAKYHVSKIQIGCQIALSCVSSIVNILSPALEARRLVIRAIGKVTACEMVLEGSNEVQGIAETANSLSSLMREAMYVADQAVRWHDATVKALEIAEDALQCMEQQERSNTHLLNCIILSVDKLERAADRKVTVNVNQVKRDVRYVELAVRPTWAAVSETQALHSKVCELAEIADDGTSRAIDAMNVATLKAVETLETSLGALERVAALKGDKTNDAK